MGKALHVLALATSLLVLASAATKESYCNLKSCNGPYHTICKYPFLQTSRDCGKVQSSTLTSAEIQEILDSHNKYRALVASGQESRGKPGPQPAASNLGSLKWDQELADIAQTWADQCNYGHDQCRNVERFSVGQNVVYGGTTGAYNSKLSDLVTVWYDEVASFNRNQVKSVTDFNGVGHYTQLVWAETTLLGCGVVRYNSDGQWNKTYLVCNYGPTGNWVGEELYKTQ